MGSRALNATESGLLLKLARASAQQILSNQHAANPYLQHPPTGISSDSPLLGLGRCFVTFKKKLPQGAPGEGLRGCLGTLEAREPLWKSVARLSADTVTSDPRFLDDPITLAELPELSIHISVLYPNRTLKNPLDFELGVDGIVVQGIGMYQGQRGVFLPQVATEFGWSKEEFLASCCSHKAHLPEDAWKNSNTCRVEAFKTQSLSD